MTIGDVADVWLFFFIFADDKESVDKESKSSPLVETFRFLLFFFFLSLCVEISQRILFLCLSRLTGIGLCSSLLLFSGSCTCLDLSTELLSMIKFFSGVQYRILMRLLKILKHRYRVYDNLTFFCISGQNWKRREEWVQV